MGLVHDLAAREIWREKRLSRENVRVLAGVTCLVRDLTNLFTWGLGIAISLTRARGSKNL